MPSNNIPIGKPSLSSPISSRSIPSIITTTSKERIPSANLSNYSESILSQTPPSPPYLSPRSNSSSSSISSSTASLPGLSDMESSDPVIKMIESLEESSEPMDIYDETAQSDKKQREAVADKLLGGSLESSASINTTATSSSDPDLPTTRETTPEPVEEGKHSDRDLGMEDDSNESDDPTKDMDLGSSPASTARDGATPRAEIPQPMWSRHGTPRNAGKAKRAEDKGFGSGSQEGGGTGSGTPEGTHSRENSWRRKYYSMDTKDEALRSAFQQGINLRMAPLNLASPQPQPKTEFKPILSASSSSPEPYAISKNHPNPGKYKLRKEYLDEEELAKATRRDPSVPFVPPANTRIVAQSYEANMFVAVPIEPTFHFFQKLAASTPLPSSSASAKSSTSNTSSSSSQQRGDGISDKSIESQESIPSAPACPRWACPPQFIAEATGKAYSPEYRDVKRPATQRDLDFDPELFESDLKGDNVTVIKGEQGGVCVRKAARRCEVMFWIPGIQQENITVSCRKNETLLISANDWDAGICHQWYVMLGPDADTKSAIDAVFTPDRLLLNVQRTRQHRFRPDRLYSQPSDTYLLSRRASEAAIPVPPPPPTKAETARDTGGSSVRDIPVHTSGLEATI